MSELPAVLPATSRAPYYVSWEITRRCDARCVFCYSDSGPDVDCSEELSTGEALGVIDQLADAGSLMLAFSGGEPLLRSDCLQLLRYASARGLVTTMVTNGSRLGEAEADDLRDLGVESVTVSLDSHRAEVHDELRQLPGLYVHAVAAIRRLVAREVPVVVNFIPTRENWLDLEGVVELSAELGARAVCLSEYVAVGRGSTRLLLDPDETEALFERWDALRHRYLDRLTLIAGDRRVATPPSCEAAGDSAADGLPSASCPDCGAGNAIARVLSDGSVTPCSFLTLPLGSLRHQAFAELWQRGELVREARARAGPPSAACGSCGMLLRSQQ